MRGVTSSTSAELSAEGTVPLQPGEGALAGSQANISETDEFFYTDDLGKEHGEFIFHNNIVLKFNMYDYY